MTISYLITACNETETLRNLLFHVILHVVPEDEIVVVLDQDNKSEETEKIILDYQKSNNNEGNFKVIYHSLHNNYGHHKNVGIEHCSKNFIFQIDGDECPPISLLGENLRALIDSNPTIEAYAIARINDFRGVTEEHAKQQITNYYVKIFNSAKIQKVDKIKITKSYQ